MARIRTIKPEFFRHEELFQAESESGLPLRLAFAGLWTACDREGRFKWSPKALKLDCLPYDDVDFSRVLDALATRGFIVKYSSENNLYGYVPGFSRHQVINNREAPSKLPQPIETNVLLTRDPRVIDACATRLVHAQGERKGKEGKGREREGNGEETREQVLASPEPEIEPLPVSKTKNPKPQVLRGTRWHPDNIIPDEWIDAANAAREKAGSAPVDMRHEVVKFSHYWASPDARNPLKKDWRQTFINWILNSKGKQDGKKSTVVDSVNALMALGRKAGPVDDMF